MKKAFLFSILVVLFFCVSADVPRIMNYQAKLTDTDGVAITDTTDSGCGCAGRTIAFFISREDSTTLWADTLCVKIVNGLFDVQLDLSVNGGDALKFDEPYFIQLMIDHDDDGVPDELLVPREKIAMVSFAGRSIYADTAGHYKVHHDATLTGDGTESAPLHAVGDNWGTQTVVHDATMAGDGTSSAPLSVLSGTSASSSGQWKQQLMFWEAYLKCQGCEALIPDWSDTISKNVWLRAVGGGTNDYAYSVVQAYDGGILAVGNAYSFGAGSSDAFLVKFDVYGNMEWAKTIGGTDYERGWSIIKTSDTAYVLTGQTQSYGSGNYDLFIAKVDTLGNLLWFKTFGTSSNDDGRGVIQTSDRGFVAAGYTWGAGAGNNDFLVVKFDSLGNVEWAKAIGGTSNDYAWAVAQSAGGDYFVTGGTNSFGAGGYDIMLVKLDSAGNLLWARTVGGSSDDFGYSEILTDAGNVLLAGYTESSFGSDNAGLLAEFSPDGSMNWAKIVDGDSSDVLRSVIKTSDGGYALAGDSRSWKKNRNLWIVKLNLGGNVEWSRVVGDTSGYENGYSIVQLSGGEYVVVGYTQSYGAGNYDAFLVKFTQDGYTCKEDNAFPTISTITPTVGNITPTVTDLSISSTSYGPYQPSCAPTVTKICTD